MQGGSPVSAVSRDAQIERDAKKDAEIDRLTKGYSQLNTMYQKLSVEKTEVAKFERAAQSALEVKVTVSKNA